MANLASERIPIATLHPALPTPTTKSITSIVTILWPYSSSTRTCALLLAEPDFRLRRRRGQVRVQFFGDAAYAVATSQLGIGDKVMLKLAGAQWLQSSGEDEVVRTPGKSVEWELGFKDRLAMLVTRDGKQFANLDVEASTPEPVEEETEEEAVYNTPSKIVGRFNAEGLRFNTWSSPAFLKHGRLSGDFLSDYDPFADEDESKSRKRRRTSFKNVGVWTIAPRTPSPEKGDAVSEDDDDLASRSERPFASALQERALPDTPVSSMTTPSEAMVEHEDDLVPEVSHDDVLPSRESASDTERIVRKDLREDLKDQQDAQYKQYLREASEANRRPVEGDKIDEFPDEPEDELAAEYSIQDANIIQGESDPEPLPTVIPDTEEAVPSAAASVTVDDYAGNTERESDMEEPDVVEMSSTEADSEEEPSEYEDQDSIPRPQTRRKRHRPTAEEETSEDRRDAETTASPLQPPEQAPSKLAGSGVPMRAPRQLPAQRAAEDIESDSESLRRPAYARRPSMVSLSSTDEDDMSDTVLAEADQEEPMSSQAAEQMPQQPEESTPTEGLPSSVVQVAPSMPPPAIPQLQTDTAEAKSPAKTPPIGPVNAPSTPQLQPITSNALPLPSPFPVATEASSYMDAGPSTFTEPAPVDVHGDQEQHVIRPATAMSIAQSIEEPPRSLRRESGGPAVDPALQEQTVDVLDEAYTGEAPQQGQFSFGLDGAALSAIRRSRSARSEAQKAPDIADLQDTQLHDAGPSVPSEIETEEQHHDNESTDEAAMRLGQRLPDVPTSAIKSLEDSEQETPRTHGLETMVQERHIAEEPKRPQAVSEQVSELQKSRESPVRPSPKAREQVVESQLLEVERPEPSVTKQTDNIEPQENDSFNDDYAMPIIQDDDWEMPDAEEDDGAEAGFTPVAFEADESVAEDDNTPEVTPSKRMLAPAASQEAQPPASTAQTIIVDLGSDSEDEEDEQDAGILTTVESDPPVFSQGPGTQRQISQEEPRFDMIASQTQEPASLKERLQSSPPSTPQIRRRARQSTIETVTSTQTGSQKRNLRSPLASRASAASEGASGVAARVARRRRRVEVKDSECEWDSNETISTQPSSSPSVPSDGPIYGDLEPSVGLQASQILGDPSQAEQQSQEQRFERPTARSVTPVAARTISEIPDSIDQAYIEDPHDAQDRRLQEELERDTTDNRSDDLSSSPLPDPDEIWASQRKRSLAEERPTQSSQLQDDFENAGPTHSSILQEDSSMIRAMRTSQFPFETLREEQATPSVDDEEEDSLRTIRPEPQSQLVRDRSTSPASAKIPSSPRQIEESQVMVRSEFPVQALKDRSTTPLQVEVVSSPRQAEESRRSVRSEPQTQFLEKQLSSPPQAEAVSSPKRIEESERATPFESQTQVLGEQPSSPPQVVEESQISVAESSPEREVASQFPIVAPSPEREIAETQLPSQTASEDRPHLQKESVEKVKATPSTQAASPQKEVAAVPPRIHESNILTPEASQETSQLQPPVQKPRSNDILPPTPRLTQRTSTAPSFSQASARSTEAQDPQPRTEAREQSPDTIMADPPSPDLTATQPSQQLTWKPPTHPLGTRTPHSYFTPLSHLPPFSSDSLDILALCTRPSKPPQRAPHGPRDYHTSFAITDPSLPNGTPVPVQVFRPWKAALPVVEKGDAVLLRAFGVGRRGRLVSGEGSAWCVFRYGSKAGAKKGKGGGSEEESQADDAQTGASEGKKAKRKSDIMDSMKPIWADSSSGLWGAVPSASEPEPDSEKEDGAGAEETETETQTARERQKASVSGAVREEVHGPPVEFGDEERREARKLREWWAGVVRGKEVVEVKVEPEVKVEEKEEEEVKAKPKPKAKKREEPRREGDGEGEGGDGGRGSGDRRARDQRERALAMDFFRSFL